MSTELELYINFAIIVMTLCTRIYWKDAFSLDTQKELGYDRSQLIPVKPLKIAKDKLDIFAS